MKIIVLCILLLCFFSCTNKVSKSQIEFDKETQLIFHENKPYSGIVYGEEEEAYWSAEVKDGKIISETEKYPNGYKEIKKLDGEVKYYNSSGSKISKEEFQKAYQN